MLGRTAGYLVGAVAAAYLLLALFVRMPPAARAGPDLRRRALVAYAGVVFMIDVAFTLFEQVDVLLIGAIISTHAVGVFEAPLRLTVFLGYGGQALALAVAPRLVSRGAPDVRAFTRATRYLLLLQGALLAPVLVWAGPGTVHLTLGSAYEDSAAVLRALAPFIFLSGLGTYITITVNYLGEARRRVPLAIVTVLMNVVLDLILLPSIGVVGGAIATDVAFAVFAAGHFWICWDALRFPVRPLVRALARVLGAAAAMAGVLALFWNQLAFSRRVAWARLAALTAYALVLRLLGEVTGAEVEQARHAIRAFLARNQQVSG